MADTAQDLKDNYSPAEPVSFRQYNLMARLLKELQELEALKKLQGYNGGAVQALMNVNGVIKWVTVNSNCT